MWKPQKPPFRKYKKDIFGDAVTTGQFIYQIGESDILRKPSQEVLVKEINSEVSQKKIAYVKRCLRKYRKLTGVGRGIAAVQIGIAERFAVIYMSEIAGKMLVIINPVITRSSKKFLKYPEMCMSANPIIAPVVRPAWIEFEYYNEKSEKKLWQTKDETKEGRLYNRVFQHEIDHMEGIINIDAVDSNKLIFQSDPTYYDRAQFMEVKK